MIPFQIRELAIKVFGRTYQKIVAIEELSELQKEITKDLRGKGNRDHILEELVDVRIILDELVAMYDFGKDEMFVQEMAKYQRLEKTIEEEENGNQNN